MAYECISHLSREEKIRHMLRIRWHTMWRRHCSDRKRFPLAARWTSAETFIRDAMELVGYDDDALLAGKLTMVRLTDAGYYPSNMIYVNASRCPAASGQSVFVVRVPDGKQYLIVNAANFSRAMGVNPQAARRHFLRGEYSSAFEGMMMVKGFKATPESVRPYIESGEYY